MQQWARSTEEKNSGCSLTMVIIVLAVLGAICWFCFGGSSDTENDTSESVEQEITTESIDEEDYESTDDYDASQSNIKENVEKAQRKVEQEVQKSQREVEEKVQKAQKSVEEEIENELGM